MRPEWDEYFMKMAELVATRSTCLRRHVGAVIVRENHVLATGYNGPPRGCSHCKVCIREELKVPSGKMQEICKAAHAEQNAICQAARHGVSIKDSILYVTVSPCSICAKMLINAGIIEVKSLTDYPDELAREMLKEGGVKI